MFQQIEKRLRKVEELLRDREYYSRHTINTELYHRYRMEMEDEPVYALTTALVIDTIDPYKQGQVRWYTPQFIEPGVALESCPWAYPISPFGGFDDCGVSWVPPAGSTIVLQFLNGDVNNAFYHGTIWNRTRGTKDQRQRLWGIPVPEYDNVWEGHRAGYLVGSNQGDQDFMPWNTEMYNGIDIDSITDFDNNPDSQKIITYPYIYGFKTPGKHRWKAVDGDHKCNNRWMRLEMASGGGNWIMFKDDHLHPCGQWAFNGQNSTNGTSNTSNTNNTSNTSNNTNSQNQTVMMGLGNILQGNASLEITTPESKELQQGGDLRDCQTNPEMADCNGQQSNSSINMSDVLANPFYKRQEEMLPYQPPQSLQQFQANKCELLQSGIQFQSISGHQFVMDDSVDQPSGVPSFERQFDFGCNNMFTGGTWWTSTTGHSIIIDDAETDSMVRGDGNGINIITASGNSIKLNDHTLPGSESNSPSATTSGSSSEAGEHRGIFMETTSRNVFQMCDEGNQQASPPRKEGGEPVSMATGGYCLLRSGYGLQLLMSDKSNQQNTDEQFIQLLAPQKDNQERGPHQLIFQEVPEGPGFVLLRAGGAFELSSYDSSMEVVGTEDHQADKMVTVKGTYSVDIKNYYFNHNNLTIFQAEQYILLLAGRDCPGSPSDLAQQANQTAQTNVQIAQQSASQGTPNQLPFQKEPCPYPVVVGKDPWICPMFGFIHYGVMADPNDPSKITHNALSDRVFASAKEEQQNG